MKKHLTIENCEDCPFFIDTWATTNRESCKKVKKEIPYNLTDRRYPIPDFCPLPNEIEQPIKNKYNPNYDGGHDPCYG